MIQCIIFDFDGVIIESKDIKTKAYISLFEQYGQDVVDKVLEYHNISGGLSRFKKIEFLYSSLLNKKLNNRELKSLNKQFSDYVLNNIKSVEMVYGVMDFIEQNYTLYKFFISSGTPEKELNKSVKILGLEKYFVETYGAPLSKEEHIEQIIDKYNLFSQNVLFIGDSLKDKEAASKMNISFLGRTTKKSLLRNERYSIKDFSEIQKIISEINLSDLIV